LCCAVTAIRGVDRRWVTGIEKIMDVLQSAFHFANGMEQSQTIVPPALNSCLGTLQIDSGNAFVKSRANRCFGGKPRAVRILKVRLLHIA
jgi:hypothetical protein